MENNTGPGRNGHQYLVIIHIFIAHFVAFRMIIILALSRNDWGLPGSQKIIDLRVEICGNFHYCVVLSWIAQD